MEKVTVFLITIKEMRRVGYRLTFITIQSSNSPNLLIYSLNPSVSISHGMPKTWITITEPRIQMQAIDNPINQSIQMCNLYKNARTNHKLAVHGLIWRRLRCRETLKLKKDKAFVPLTTLSLINLSHSLPAHNKNTSFSHISIIIIIMYQIKLTILSFF